MQTVTLSLYRFDRPLTRAWGFAMMGFARLVMPRVPDLQFWKLCGTGTGEGFTPRAYPDSVAILCCWPDEATAKHRIKHANPFPWYRKRATDHWTIYLAPVSARGAWSGVAPFAAQGPQPDGPIAALTRATLRPGRALRFWQRVPDISQMIGADPNVLFKIGIGEVPLLHQVTFSVWPDSHAMAQFARYDGPHAQAIKAVRSGDWFREELYARFRILRTEGHWPITGQSHPERAKPPLPQPSGSEV